MNPSKKQTDNVHPRSLKAMGLSGQPQTIGEIKIFDRKSQL